MNRLTEDSDKLAFGLLLDKAKAAANAGDLTRARRLLRSALALL